MKKLLVVESPTKAKTIGRYLGKDYKVVATVGHIRDLPKNKMAVDMDKNFEIEYQIDSKKKKVIEELNKSAKEADMVLLASDPDREGEAISWHVKWILQNGKSKIKDEKISRVVFHEITKEAIEKALTEAREIDMDLVNAQQARRVLDRVVGYSLSPILWKKVRRGLSGGRVQSVAVRLICEREKEIEAFKKEKFWTISVEAGKKETFTAQLVKWKGKSVFINTKLKLFDGDYTYSKSIFKTEAEVKRLVESVGKELIVDKVVGKEVSRTPVPAFTTSKLQQAAARKMGWSGKQTMSVAQKLYEKGLISYHRTDSVYLSDKAVDEFRKYIGKEYGLEYVAEKARVYKNKSKNAQEAHEAIRPTNVKLRTIEGADSREMKLYEMIWKRAVATQAAAAKMRNTTIDLIANEALFQSKGVRMLFPGFLKITEEKHEDQILPELTVGEKIKIKEMNWQESETNPMPRYTDASLVSSLEKQGIGRPSTYAPIISTIILRQYVERDEGKFKPTVLGVATNEFLVKNFEDILSLPFTAEMEANLDEIALGKWNWKEMMKKFWKGFSAEVETAEKNSTRVKVETEKIGEKCPECEEGDLVIRLGRFGKFISCSRFPECRYSRQYKEDAGFKCPECGKEGVVRRTKTGRRFYGCSDYPKCKWAGWKKP
ncbi:MAG TPA: type I DNA topoisomerase [Candidatus Woesebacteria bacterium]|jgi:DNA topoisomerase-1|nr:type I DNA topoisomerase [Candidatus Shapirobacteria bacterium]HOR02022.1 type I DNA topoisomerase [Candidatus Woesebacteria bacterium]